MGRVVLLAWLAVRSGLAEFPRGARWRQFWGVGLLGGIGFTMSLFIAGLAFPSGPLLVLAKKGILLASFIAGTVGFILLRTTRIPSGYGR